MKEVTQIKALADQLHRNVDYLPEEEATEEHLKQELTKVASVHIATHGFASGGNTGSDDGSKTGDGGTRAVQLTIGSASGIRLATARNPFSECGLLLAGAQPRSRDISASTNTDSETTPIANILTADEIIGLDLSKCQLVTLSACQTGLGRGLNGQGVIGLRSAIIGAGAKSVLLSLWSVPDEATQELMKRFYTNLWENNMPKQEALTEAQSYIRSQEKWKAPVNWAAWVLVGE
jgi:CHAT domain-containing protein